MNKFWLGSAGVLLAAATSMAGFSQLPPPTSGETLSGQHLVVAEAVRGHASIVVAGFSKDAGTGCGEWVKAIRADQAFAGIPLYQVASLESAPGLVRGMIKSAMRKGLSAFEQDHFVVLTQDEKLWRSYFQVGGDKEPYVVLLDASGQVKWHGHGAAANLEPLLKAALK